MRRFEQIALFLMVWLWAAIALAANCTISGQVLNIDGTPAANATITLKPVVPQPLNAGGQTYTSQPVSTTTDSNGNMAAVTLPQGLFVNVTVYQNGATSGGYTAIVPFLSAATFSQMSQGIGTDPLNVLASAQPPTGPLSMNNQQITTVACPDSPGDALVWGCGNNLGPVAITGNLDFGNFAAINVGGVALVQQPAPSDITITGTCTGTCATTYTYQVTCVTATGETTGLPLTANNASSLSTANNNTLSWSAIPAACTQGYNIYGRINGSLGLMINVPQTATSWTDDGSIAAPADAYTFTWTSAGNFAVAVWDLRGAQNQNPINGVATNNGQSSSGNREAATSITTQVSNVTQIPVFGSDQNSGTFTPPGGFTNIVSIPAVNTVNYGLWGGTKNIAVAGPTGSSTGGTTGNFPWATMNIGITPFSSGSPITVIGTLHVTGTTPFTSVTFNDPPSTAAGDLEVVCVSSKQGTGLTAPSQFTLIGSTTYQTTHVQVNCYWNLPAGSGGSPPPTFNSTGGISQQIAGGSTANSLILGLMTWSADSANLPGGSSSAILKSVSFPIPMTIVSCRTSWAGFGSCTFPTFAIKDTTSNTVICSSGTVSNTATDKAVTPSSLIVPANDVLAYLATTTGSCTTGEAAMTVVMHQ